MCFTKEGVLVDRRELLKIKLKSLSDEARIIRFEEQRTRQPLRDEMSWHRRQDVRLASRTTHLAYGLIKGKALDSIEKPKEPRSQELWKAVKQMIQRYGPVDKSSNADLLAKCNG